MDKKVIKKPIDPHPHELVYFRQCTFGDGGHYYHDGFDRAVCKCGWKSAPSNDHKALVALYDIHSQGR